MFLTIQKKATRINLDGELYRGITIVLANLGEEALLLFALPIKLLGFGTAVHTFVVLLNTRLVTPHCVIPK